MRLSRVIHPFTPTERLQEHLRQYLFEYGADGREAMQWPADVIAWRVEDEAGNEAGYAWLHVGRNETPGERWLDVAVFDEYRLRGYANATLKRIEKELPALGISTLRAQVNTDKPGTGRMVRQWLMRNGFRINRPDELAHLSDEDFLSVWPRSVKFSKTYAAEQSEGGTAESAPQTREPRTIGSALVWEMKRRQSVAVEA